MARYPDHAGSIGGRDPVHIVLLLAALCHLAFCEFMMCFRILVRTTRLIFGLPAKVCRSPPQPERKLIQNAISWDGRPLATPSRNSSGRSSLGSGFPTDSGILSTSAKLEMPKRSTIRRSSLGCSMPADFGSGSPYDSQALKASSFSRRQAEAVRSFPETW